MTDELVDLPIRDTIVLVRGADYHETTNYYEDDKVTPEDTTGWSSSLYILSNHRNGKQYDLLSTNNGRIINTPASGQFNYNWLAAEIDAYDFIEAVFREVVIDNLGGVVGIRIGEVKVV